MTKVGPRHDRKFKFKSAGARHLNRNSSRVCVKYIKLIRICFTNMFVI